MPNLYLIGMMGSGKTVTGRALGALLKRSFLDLDEYLEKKLARSIPDIFETEGEIFFREQETKILNEISKKDLQVIATGGGVILRADNVSRMKNTGRLIYLAASSEMLWQRLKEKLAEEVAEFLKAKKPEDARKELADIQEVLFAILEFKGWDVDEFDQLRNQKLAEKGGFKKRTILDEA